MISKNILLATLFLASSLVYASEDRQKYKIITKHQNFIIVTTDNDYQNGSHTLFTISNQTTGEIQQISSENGIREEPLDIHVEDYNFDGYKDLSFSHTDDGMGVYEIYDIFIFNRKNKKFESLTIPPNTKAKCDGGFADVRLNHKKKMVIIWL